MAIFSDLFPARHGDHDHGHDHGHDHDHEERPLGHDEHSMNRHEGRHSDFEDRRLATSCSQAGSRTGVRRTDRSWSASSSERRSTNG